MRKKDHRLALSHGLVLFLCERPVQWLRLADDLLSPDLKVRDLVRLALAVWT